jgi:hypothetical protein
MPYIILNLFFKYLMGILCILSKYHEGEKNQQKFVNFYTMQHPWARVFLKSKP